MTVPLELRTERLLLRRWLPTELAPFAALTEGAGAVLRFGFESLALDEIVFFTVPPISGHAR